MDLQTMRDHIAVQQRWSMPSSSRFSERFGDQVRRDAMISTTSNRATGAPMKSFSTSNRANRARFGSATRAAISRTNRPIPSGETYPTHDLYFKSPDEMKGLVSDLSRSDRSNGSDRPTDASASSISRPNITPFHPSFAAGREEFPRRSGKKRPSNFSSELCEEGIVKRLHPEKFKQVEERSIPSKDPMRSGARPARLRVGDHHLQGDERLPAHRLGLYQLGQKARHPDGPRTRIWRRLDHALSDRHHRYRTAPLPSLLRAVHQS